VEAPEGTAARPALSAIENDIGFDRGIAARIDDARASVGPLLHLHSP